MNVQMSIAEIIKNAAGLEIKEAVQTQDDIIKAAAAALGRKGGLKGGKARAAALTPKRRSEIAKKAAKARWHKK